MIKNSLIGLLVSQYLLSLSALFVAGALAGSGLIHIPNARLNPTWLNLVVLVIGSVFLLGGCIAWRDRHCRSQRKSFWPTGASLLAVAIFVAVPLGYSRKGLRAVLQVEAYFAVPAGIGLVGVAAYWPRK